MRECLELRLRLRSGEEGMEKNSLGGRSADSSEGVSSPTMGTGGIDVRNEFFEEREEYVKSDEVMENLLRGKFGVMFMTLDRTRAPGGISRAACLSVGW